MNSYLSWDKFKPTRSTAPNRRCRCSLDTIRRGAVFGSALWLACIATFVILTGCGGGGADTDSSGPPPGDYTTAAAYLEAEGFVGSVLVMRGGVDVVRAGYGFANKVEQHRNGTDTRFRIGSVSKSFTALAIAHLHSVGLIDSYDDPVSRYLPTYPRGDEITVRHLVTHRSGIPDYIGDVDQGRHYSPQQLVALFVDRALQFAPGEQFDYSNANYVLLGVLIESLSGVRYPEYLQVNILGPLGMIHTGYATDTPSHQDEALGYRDRAQNQAARYLDMSIPYAAGALVSTLGDLEIWARSFQERTFLAPESYADLLIDGQYGFGWASDTFGGKSAYWHDGAINGFSAIVAFFPDDDGVVIALSNVEGEAARLQRIVTTMARNEL